MDYRRELRRAIDRLIGDIRAAGVRRAAELVDQVLSRAVMPVSTRKAKRWFAKPARAKAKPVKTVKPVKKLVKTKKLPRKRAKAVAVSIAPVLVEAPPAPVVLAPKRYACKKCGESGHNARTCGTQPATAAAPKVDAEDPDEPMLLTRVRKGMSSMSAQARAACDRTKLARAELDAIIVLDVPDPDIDNLPVMVETGPRRARKGSWRNPDEMDEEQSEEPAVAKPKREPGTCACCPEGCKKLVFSKAGAFSQRCGCLQDLRRAEKKLASLARTETIRSRDVEKTSSLTV